MARRKAPVIADQLLGGADAKTAFEKDAFLDELKKTLAKRTLESQVRSSPGDGRGGRAHEQLQWVSQEAGID